MRSRHALLLVPLTVLSGAALCFLVPWASPEPTGSVVDEQGLPIAGARVRWQATPLLAITDAQGRFTLPAGPSQGRLTAAHPGYFITGLTPEQDARSLKLVLRELPRDNTKYPWVDPGPENHQEGNCASCHAEIHREWSTSGHARSATGEAFRQLYEGTDAQGRPGVGWGVLTQNELGAAVCVSCHAPAVQDDEPGALDLRELKGNAQSGVHCDYCHKVEGLAGPIDGLSHGRFNLRLRRPAPGHGEQLFFGPLDDVDRGEDSYSPFQRESRFCAACHEGVVFGVPVYTTFSEWQASPAGQRGQSCQSCHMAPTGRMTNIAPGQGGLERDPATLGNHRFFAHSQQDMLRSALYLNGTFRRADAIAAVTATVQATNVGHRIPTGYIDRHLILVAEACDVQGKTVAPLTGPRLPGPAGALAGQPGHLFGRLLSDPEGKQPAPFWLSRNDVVDTRLSPEQAETFAWTFPATVHRVRFRLIYRRFWEVVTRTKGWPPGETIVRETTLDARRE